MIKSASTASTRVMHSAPPMAKLVNVSMSHVKKLMHKARKEETIERMVFAAWNIQDAIRLKQLLLTLKQ